MTTPFHTSVQPVIIVNNLGQCVPVQVNLFGTSICEAEQPLRPVAVDADGKLITSKTRVGDLAEQLMTPALPAAGAEAVTGLHQALGFEDVVISIFADQPGNMFIEESYDGITFRRTAALLVNVASVLVTGIFVPSRAFFRVVWDNTGAAAVTILEVTVTKRGNCGNADITTTMTITTISV